MHACMHTYIHACIHAYIHTCIHAYMHPDAHAHTRAHTAAGQRRTGAQRLPGHNPKVVAGSRCGVEADNGAAAKPILGTVFVAAARQASVRLIAPVRPAVNGGRIGARRLEDDPREARRAGGVGRADNEPCARGRSGPRAEDADARQILRWRGAHSHTQVAHAIAHARATMAIWRCRTKGWCPPPPSAQGTAQGRTVSEGRRRSGRSSLSHCQSQSHRLAQAWPCAQATAPTDVCAGCGGRHKQRERQPRAAPRDIGVRFGGDA
jgi:hypothetical protein